LEKQSKKTAAQAGDEKTRSGKLGLGEEHPETFSVGRGGRKRKKKIFEGPKKKREVRLQPVVGRWDSDPKAKQWG